MLTRMMEPALAAGLLHEVLPAFRTHRRAQLRSLSIADIKPGPSWTVQYHCELDSKPALLVVQHVPDGDLELGREKLLRQAGRLRPERRSLADLVAARPELRLLIWPFPLDPKLRRLPEAADDVQARLALQASPRLASLIPQAADCQVEVLRYVPGRRCQLRYRFTGRDGAVTFLGKMLPRARAQALYEAMNTVAEHYLACKAGALAAARALEFLDEWDMVVQEHLPGATLHELMHKGLAREDHIVSAARSIAHLHRARFEPRKRHVVEDEIALIERSVHNLAASGTAESAFTEALEGVAALGRSLAPSPLAPVHRDFYDKQLLIEASRAALIDLDTLAAGCVEIDLANFAAHLRLRSLQGVIGAFEANSWQQMFLAEYELASERRIGEDLLRFFLTTALLRLACKYRLSEQGAVLGPALLDGAEAALRDGVALPLLKES